MTCQTSEKSTNYKVKVRQYIQEDDATKSTSSKSYTQMFVCYMDDVMGRPREIEEFSKICFAYVDDYMFDEAGHMWT